MKYKRSEPSRIILLTNNINLYGASKEGEL